MDEWGTRKAGGDVPLCLGAPVPVCRDLEVAERVAFLSVGLEVGG